MRPTRLAYLLVPAFGAAILAVACSDRSPVAPLVAIERPDLDLAGGGSLRGLAVTTIRAFDGDNFMGSILASDTTTFQAAIVPGGRSAARIMAGAEEIELLVAVGDHGTPARTGSWTVQAGRRIQGPNTSITFTAANGAPVSEATRRRGGQVVSRVSTEWARARGGWVVIARTISVYQNGRLARSITTTFDDPHVAHMAYSRTPITRLAVAPAVRDVPAVPRFDLYGEDGEPCAKEVDAVEDALDAFLLADALLIACLGGPLPCLAAGANVIYRAHVVDVAEGRLDECIAKI